MLGRFGVPTATALQIYNDVLDKRSQIAMEILLKELRQGNFECVDQNDAVSIIARYQRNAMEGVAKNNLRLIACVINGMSEKKSLKAPTFLKYANILADLTDDEIIVLGIMAKLNWGTFIGDRGDTECRKLGINNMQSIQQALLRTGLLTMQIEITISDERENKALSIRGDELTSEQVYLLTTLFSEIEGYIENFDMKEDEAVA
ncbi:MAG: hypothetical protein KAJ40_03630 [Alphaproteobacteria bacterium]|nr:hypothetical protein [Alphaproteobacteria bacterium]